MVTEVLNVLTPRIMTLIGDALNAQEAARQQAAAAAYAEAQRQQALLIAQQIHRERVDGDVLEGVEAVVKKDHPREEVNALGEIVEGDHRQKGQGHHRFGEDDPGSSAPQVRPGKSVDHRAPEELQNPG